MQLYDSNEYRASKHWPYAIASGTVVYRITHGLAEVLLLKRAAGSYPQLRDGHIDTYHLPKGHIHFGEALEQAALRETAEEAGCVVELVGYLGSQLGSYDDLTIKQEKTIHYFAALWQKDLDTMDGEHSEKQWVTIEAAAALIGTKNPKHEYIIIDRLKKFLELTT